MQQQIHCDLEETVTEEPFEYEMPSRPNPTPIERVSHIARRFGLPRRAILRLEEDEIEILGLIIGQAGQYVSARELAEAQFGDQERWRDAASKVNQIKAKLNAWSWLDTRMINSRDGVTAAYGIAA
jgi:hypothetical protein